MNVNGVAVPVQELELGLHPGLVIAESGAAGLEAEQKT